MNTAKRRININWLLWTLQKEELILTDFWTLLWTLQKEELILTDFCEHCKKKNYINWLLWTLQKEELILTDFCEHCKKKN